MEKKTISKLKVFGAVIIVAFFAVFFKSVIVFVAGGLFLCTCGIVFSNNDETAL